MSIAQRKLLRNRIRKLREDQELTQAQLTLMIGNASKQYIKEVDTRYCLKWYRSRLCV